MKKTIALLAAVCSLTLASAQEQAPAPGTNTSQQPRKGPSPEMMAQRHSKHLQKQLGLSDDQTQKTYTAMLTRFQGVQAAREKAGPNPDRKALHSQVKPIRQAYVQTMNGILTADQKTKWEAMRLEMKQKRAQHMSENGKGNPPPPADNKDNKGGNPDPKKLTDEDDGLD